MCLQDQSICSVNRVSHISTRIVNFMYCTLEHSYVVHVYPYVTLFVYIGIRSTRALQIVRVPTRCVSLVRSRTRLWSHISPLAPCLCLHTRYCIAHSLQSACADKAQASASASASASSRAAAQQSAHARRICASPRRPRAVRQSPVARGRTIISIVRLPQLSARTSDRQHQQQHQPLLCERVLSTLLRTAPTR